jgi:hypothetical protein
MKVTHGVLFDKWGETFRRSFDTSTVSANLKKEADIPSKHWYLNIEFMKLHGLLS